MATLTELLGSSPISSHRSLAVVGGGKATAISLDSSRSRR
jgi:hypothetical protein